MDDNKRIKALQKLIYDVECLMNDLKNTPDAAVNFIKESLEKAKNAAKIAGIDDLTIKSVTQMIEDELAGKHEISVLGPRDVGFVILEAEGKPKEELNSPEQKKKKKTRKITTLIFLVVLVGLAMLFFKTQKEVKEEKIKVVINNMITNSLLDPLTISGEAGEIVEFHYDKNSCFYVSGNYESNAYPPSSEEAYLGFRTEDGVEYRLADHITSYRFPSDGQIRFFVRIAEKGSKVWSGTSKNCAAKRLSEFKKGPVYITIKRIGEGKMESDDAEVAKIIRKTKTIKASYKEQDKKMEEAAKIIRSTLKKGYAYLFNRPLIVETPKTKESSK